MGPGPSLDRQLGLIARTAPGKVVVAALDTALRALAQAAVPVELAFTLHPLDGNLAKVEGLRLDFPLVYFEGAHPRIAAASPRPLFACEAGGLLDRAHPLFGAAGRYASEGTVLLAALEVLDALAVEQTGLCGIDLALAGEVSHAGGRRADAGTRLQVPARGGGSVLTTPSLDLHRRRLERWLARKPRRLVDLTAAGATVAGLEARPLEEWLADAPAHPATDLRRPDPSRTLGRDFRADQARQAARLALEAATRQAGE
ncbi:MAG: DUF115 domain-containing protein [Acidobacteriota bacterium]|nr:DUF115 domain-containing protein [Acidobacteriota bacterium]